MNQEKIGDFIAKIRKEKNMTQQNLADKLSVSDKTISKWENGRGMPDLSLISPLCDILEITINELLSGEYLNESNYQYKQDENIINAINYSRLKIKSNNKIFRIIIGIIIGLVVLIMLMFFIDVRQMNRNKEVIFSTWGFKYSPAIDISDLEIYGVIKNYLVEKGDSEDKNHIGIKTFVSMHSYLLEDINSEKYYVYAWVNEAKYYLENDELKKDTGLSVPYKFVVEKRNNQYYVSDSRTPRAGSYYEEDMKNIFPKSVRKDMENVYDDGTSMMLELDIEEQVKLFFHK